MHFDIPNGIFNTAYVNEMNGLRSFFTLLVASTFPVGLNLTKSFIRIFVNKCVRLIDILKMTSGNSDLGLRSYHMKSRSNRNILLRLDISYLAVRQNFIFLVCVRTDVISGCTPQTISGIALIRYAERIVPITNLRN